VATENDVLNHIDRLQVQINKIQELLDEGAADTAFGAIMVLQQALLSQSQTSLDLLRRVQNLENEVIRLSER